MSPGLLRRSAAALVLGLIGVVLAVQIARSFGSTQDDAFITYRYATHLAQGEGLVYNPGERVEGYTNFLWTVLLAGLVAVGGDPVALAPWIGVLFAVGSGILVLLGGNSGGTPGEGSGGEGPSASWVLGASGLAAALFYVAGSAVAAEAVQGLETPLFAFLVTGALLLDAREREIGRPRGGRSGWLYALAALTRPEGLMAFGVAGLCRLPAFLRGRSARGARVSRSGEIVWGASVLATVAAHVLFRLVYYGDVVPNTAHAKVSFSAAVLVRGLQYVGSFAIAYGPVLLLAAAGSYLERARERTRLLAAWIVVDVAYVAWVGGDYKPTFRFFAAVIPALCLLAGRGLTGLAADVSRRSARWSWIHGAGVATAVLLVIGSAGARDFTAWRRSWLPIHEAAGRWLASRFPQGTWLATNNAGVLPYYSGLPTIDMLGLCDKVIARRPASPDAPSLAGHEKGDGAYVLSRRPDVILFMQARFTDQPLPESEVEGLAFGVSEWEILGTPSFHRDYVWESSRLQGFVFNYYLRRGGGVSASPGPSG